MVISNNSILLKQIVFGEPIRRLLVHSDTEYRPIESPVSHQNLDQ